MTINKRNNLFFASIILSTLMMFVFSSNSNKSDLLSEPIVLTNEGITKTINQSSDIILISISRDTCSACKLLYPKLRRLVKKYKHPIYIYDTTSERENKTTEYSEFIMKYEITSIPTILIVKDGVVLAHIDETNIDNRLEEHLKNGLKFH